MRGKVREVVNKGQDHGITPVCAGKRAAAHQRRRSGKDHPRVCGEKTLYIGIGRTVVGSPPHVRGKVTFAVTFSIAPGITPAYAGKREMPPTGAARTRDHPRTCGEKFSPAVAAQFWKGSPPHMRGKGAGIKLNIASMRITPAHAGKSACSSSSSGAPWDHPRVCGEKCCCAASIRSRSASRPSQFPPRMTVISPRP